MAWARRINARWIVHGGLDDTAAAYMDRLESTDQRRLALSCRIARALTGKAGAGEDPKAWFYAGLFSMAEPVEVAEFLLGHRLVTTVLFADPVAESHSDTTAGVDGLARRSHAPCHASTIPFLSWRKPHRQLPACEPDNPSPGFLRAPSHLRCRA